MEANFTLESLNDRRTQDSLKVVTAETAIVATAITTAPLESIGQSRRGRDHYYPVFREVLCDRELCNRLALPQSRRGSLADVC